MGPLKYYSQEKIQKAIIRHSLHKEVVASYGGKGFGKRPDTLNYDSDILELAKQGATSFHISEEHWKNPRNLVPGMTKRQLDELRKGWDFILDIDSPNLEHSKIIAHFLIQAMKFHDITNISVKFSGNKGFHIGVPFKSFPDEFNDTPLKELFPDSARIVANYLTEMIRPHLSERLKNENIEEVLKVDTVLISPRHLYRAPYSLHEKSGLASLPIDPETVLEFNKTDASPEKIEPTLNFLEHYSKDEATLLLSKAHEWHQDIERRKSALTEDESKETKEYSEFTETVPEQYFPQDIKQGLSGMKDGKKRFLFVLINFLKCIGWEYKEVEKKVREWNKNNPEPLKEGYIISQLAWHKRQREKILPPNYSNDAYYKDLGLDCSESLRRNMKNPVNYAIRMYKINQKKKK